MPGEIGMIEAGALADLLLVDGDPLADIALFQDQARLRMVMKDGVLHKNAIEKPDFGYRASVRVRIRCA